MDFTDAGELRVNIAGLPFPHLFFEFILSHSGWRFVDLAFGETFEALQKGLQGALWALGGLPQVVRTDNLSAATHELKETKGRTPDPALCCPAGALRSPGYPYQPQIVSRKRRGGAGPLPA